MGRFKKGDIVYTMYYGLGGCLNPLDCKIVKVELTSDEYLHESNLDDLNPEEEEYDCIYYHHDFGNLIETIKDKECFSSSQELFNHIYLQKKENYDQFINDLFSANPNEAKRYIAKKRTSKLK